MSAEDGMDDSDDNRLKILETQGVKTESRLTHVENTLVVHGAKLDQIITAVTVFSGRPVFDVHKIISSIRDVVVVGGAFSTLAVWFVLTLTAAETRTTELKISTQKEAFTKEIDHLQDKQQLMERLLMEKWSTRTEKVTP